MELWKSGMRKIREVMAIYEMNKLAKICKHTIGNTK